MISLSIIVPVFNEEKLIKESCLKYIKFFEKHPKVKKFEIILSENGSTDSSKNICRILEEQDERITSIYDKDKGIGRALRNAILKAKYPYVYFNAVDIPFNFLDFELFLDEMGNKDIIFASKNNPNSVYRAKFVRKFASTVASYLIRLLFDLPLTDTQGTCLFKKNKLLPILPFCTSNQAFFQTQLAIYAWQKKLILAEVPVYYEMMGRKSKFRLVSDGLKFTIELVWEKIKLSCNLRK